MSGLIETDSSLVKTAATVNDNLDTRSVCSSVCSSMKNTELIMAAFSTQPLTLTIEEEKENSTEASFSAGSFTNSQKSFNNSTNADPASDRANNSTEYLIEEATDESSKSKKEEFSLLNNLLEDTIANVASGSISKETTKVIADKQNLMLKHSKAQEKHYYQLKKLREKEQKKKALKRLEKARQIERKKPNKKNKQDKGTYNEDDEEISNVLSLKSPNSEPNTSAAAHIEHPPLFKIKKKLNSVNFIDQTLNKRKLTKAQQKLNTNSIQPPVRQKPGPKPKLKIEDPELIFEPTTHTFHDDYDEDDDEYVDEEEEDTEQIDLYDESTSSDTQINLRRQCLVCKRHMHQDKLNDHCVRHYYESAKCSDCDKVSTNSSNFVTHLLSHLPAQFFCLTCTKWFRQPIVYKRHQNECTGTATTNTVNRNNSQNANTSLKRKAAAQVETLPDTLKLLDHQDNKRSRRGRHPSITSSGGASSSTTKAKLSMSVEPVKRKQGRPRKNQTATPSEKHVTSINGTNNPLETTETEEESTNNTNHASNKRSSLEEAKTRKSLRSSKSSLTKAKSEGASIVVSTRKTSNRLLSISSAVSSSSSVDNQNGNSNSQHKKRQSEKFEEMEVSPVDSNDFDDDTVSEQMNDIDDIVVSDYEIDDSSRTEADRSDQRTAESVSARLDQKKALAEVADPCVKQLNNNLTSCATYKVKIQLRRPSNNSSKQIKETPNDSLNASVTQTPQTPSKLLNNVFLHSNNTANTPAKSDLTSNNPLTNPNITNTNSHEFACPECDKKFVSYYGLFAHYDNHPTLAVSCQICQISFENHQALIAHNAKQHPHFHADFNEFKSSRLNAEVSKSAGGQPSKKNDKPLTTLPSTATPAATTTTTTASNRSAKQSLNFQAKSKSQSTDLVASTSTDLHANDLSALPSIMTRTSRLANNDNKASNINNNNNNNTISNAVSLRTAAAISNHNLPFKTTGFADLSFIDFSCMNFPRIAQNYCELWPRKPASASSDFLHQQLQPLHNYSCNHCGYYFPSVASLRLHRMKKHLASTELTQSYQVEPACPLFMTNSKSMCYEKCLDEIITQIEEEQERSGQEAEDEFLALVGLVPVAKLKKQSTSEFVRSSTGKAKQLNDQLIDYISPVHVALSDGLLGELRRLLLTTNTQFIVELDRWKLMNSSCLEKIDAYSSKIHLKPHVNLNRPLLIRSKKLKRNLTKKNLMKEGGKGGSSVAVSPRHQPFRSSQLAQAIKAAPIVSPVLEPKVSASKEVLKIATATAIVEASITIASTTTTATTTTMPKLSKPFFTATSGGFSGGAIQQQQQKTTGNQLKKRKQEQTEIKSEHKNKKSKQKQQQSQKETPASNSQSPSSVYQAITTDSSKFETTDEILLLNETEDDDDYNYYDADEKDTKFDLPTFSKPQKPTPAVPHSSSNGTSYQKNSASSTPATNITQPKTSFRKIAPQPPPLYKAPQINTAIFTSAANSSILANASGMNNNLAKRNMPKLVPANCGSQNNSSSNKNPNVGRNSGDCDILMPKLKPILPASPSAAAAKIRNAPSKPPQLIKNSPIQQNTTELQGKTASSSNINKALQQPQQQSPGQNSASKLSPKKQPKQTKQQQNSVDSNNSPTPTPSLKCKFCFQIFEGQPEFFQHVIKSHPRMLEQRLNRSNSTAQTTTPVAAGSKTNAKAALSSNGNSNHSTSSVGSSSNASNHPK